MTAASLHAVMKPGGAAGGAANERALQSLQLRLSNHWQRSLLMRDGLHTDVHYQRHQHFSLRNSGSACTVLSTERIQTLITHASSVYVILCVLYAACLTSSQRLG